MVEGASLRKPTLAHVSKGFLNFGNASSDRAYLIVQVHICKKHCFKLIHIGQVDDGLSQLGSGSLIKRLSDSNQELPIYRWSIKSEVNFVYLKINVVKKAFDLLLSKRILSTTQTFRLTARRIDTKFP